MNALAKTIFQERLDKAAELVTFSTADTKKRPWHLKAGAFEVWIVRDAAPLSRGREVFLTLPFKCVDGCQVDYDAVMVLAQAVADLLNGRSSQ